MRGFLLCAPLLLGLGAPAVAQTAPDWLPRRQAELQALDKITARITVLKATVGQTVSFGTLAITVRACMARPSDEVADAAAWLEIADTRQSAAPSGTQAATGSTPPSGFRGWMFAEAPAVHMLEHPVYDIRILSCK